MTSVLTDCDRQPAPSHRSRSIKCLTKPFILTHAISFDVLKWNAHQKKQQRHVFLDLPMSSVVSLQSSQETHRGHRHPFLPCAYSCWCEQEAHNRGHRGLAPTYRHYPVQILQDSGSDHWHWERYVIEWNAWTIIWILKLKWNVEAQSVSLSFSSKLKAQ